MAIDGIGINAENWRAKPLKEIVNNLDVVQEEDSDCAKWAQAMSAVANAPDNVTYDMAGGSIEEFTAELEAISQNGLPVEEQPEDMAPPEDVEGIGKADEVPPEEEEPEVGDIDEAADEQTAAEAATANDPNAAAKTNLVAEDGADEPTSEVNDATAADSINTDNEAIQKRKIKKGEKPQE
ncbi:MAG: hypothetical protein NC390_08235 [Fusobacterium sp.]|nr:hypothetical protein [Fusobacterium sp.]